MKPHIVYFIGSPGTGKSTLMRAIMDAMNNECELVKEDGITFHKFPEWEAIVLGIYDEETFSGTDRLSKAIGPKFREWLKTTPERYPGWTIVGEGERFSNNPTLDAMHDGIYKMDLVRVTVTDSVLEERRAARNNTQDPKWMKGMETRIRNLCNKYPHIELDLSDWDREKGLTNKVVNGLLALD